MPLLITLSVISDALESIPVNNGKPFTLTSGNLILEIAWENGQYFVSCNQELQINFARCYFAKLATDDLIFFQNRFIIFQENADTENNKLFVCNFLKNGKNTFFFKLPEKIYTPIFSSIFKVAACHRTVKQLYIDCRATQYMNNQSVEDMLNLARKLKERRIAVCFYEPCQKFLSYLKLANIEKLIPVKYSNEAAFDNTIKALRASDYVITQNGTDYVIQPEKVLCVGRANASSHISLADRYVSRTHALIVNISDRLYVIDCSSGNHTFINEDKITPLCLYRLFAEDAISFGGNENFRIEQRAPLVSWLPT
jgi:hypothetical protein